MGGIIKILKDAHIIFKLTLDIINYLVKLDSQ